MAGTSSNGNQSYQQRSAANPARDKAYSTFLNGLSLQLMDRIQLKQRGLSDEQIKAADYRTKPLNNDRDLQRAIAMLEASGAELKNLPGFFIDERKNKWSCSGNAGIVIPSRDIDGHINSLLIRQDNNSKNKYISFSSKKGATAGNTTHCPITHAFKHRSEIGTTIRLTEGLLKADVASALDKTKYTLGIHGLRSAGDLTNILQELEISRVIISFDMEATGDVQKTKLGLWNQLRKDYDVTFEVWDEKYKGIDDALLHAPDSIRVLESQEAKEHIGKVADPNSAPYIYVISTERFYHIEDCKELNHSQFSTTFMMSGPGQVLELLSADNQPPFPRCDDIEFAPGREKTFAIGRRTKFNSWRPNPIEPAEGDVSVFLEHMEYIIPSVVERGVLLQWMAFQRQCLGEKIHWAVLFQGLPGIGKSFIGNIMSAMLGPENISKPSNQELHEIYSSWEKQCSLVIVEEVMVSDKQDLMNKLKPKITEPVTRVREMHKAAYEQPNRYNMLLLTNHENALRIDDTDRRYYVIYSPAEHRSPEYYIGLFNWAAQPESIAALQHWAINYDLTGFVAKGHAPRTEARKEMIHQSRNRLEEFIMLCMEERRWPFQMDIVSIGDLKNSKYIHREFSIAHERRWAAALKVAGAKQLKNGGQIDLGDGIRRRLWALRRPELWMDPDLSIERIAEEYAKWSGSGQPGGNPLDDAHPMQA